VFDDFVDDPSRFVDFGLKGNAARQAQLQGCTDEAVQCYCAGDGNTELNFDNHDDASDRDTNSSWDSDDVFCDDQSGDNVFFDEYSDDEFEEQCLDDFGACLADVSSKASRSCRRQVNLALNKARRRVTLAPSNASCGRLGNV